MRNPIFAKGLVLAKRIKKTEVNLIETYWEMGVWLRDELPQTSFTMSDFAEAAGISSQQLYKYRDVAKAYGSLDNIPADYTMNTAHKFRQSYIDGLCMPKAMKPGDKYHGIEAVIRRSGSASSWIASAVNAMYETSYVNDMQRIAIEEIVSEIRAEATVLLAETKRRNQMAA